VQQGKTFIMVTHDNDLARRMPRLVQVFDGELYEGMDAHIAVTA
jgi:predicted ABC-type transport system involved in lysophospholipase L1 biosynthesis ATPase subunit